MQIEELFKQGITKVRLPKWANPLDHIEITTVNIGGERYMGPWVKLSFDYQNADLETTDKILLIQAELHTDWVEWKAPDGTQAG